MRPLVKYLLMTLAVLLNACSTPENIVKTVTDAQLKVMAIRTLEGECSGPCKFAYTDPRDRAASSLRLPTNGWDTTNALIGSTERVLTNTVTPAAAVRIAGEIRRAGSGGNTSIQMNASGSGSSNGGSGSYQQNSSDSSRHDVTATDSSRHDVTTIDNSNHDNATADPPQAQVVKPELVRPEVVFTQAASP